jgi:3'-phosphoadenosine 5'-phosphosulfate sulfotransferase (PAPS reductase)/FAD synthetase
MSEPIHIISLGAGVQSSTMSLMAAKGEITPMPKCAIFADTGSEPKRVYEWVERLGNMLNFPLRICKSHLGPLHERIISYGFSQIPAWMIGTNGKPTLGKKQCTNHWKIRPVTKDIRAFTGTTGKIVPKEHFHVWKGISTDEISRMKDSVIRSQKAVFPLIDQLMSREHCRLYLHKLGLPTVKSACVFCPYRSDKQWQESKQSGGDEWDIIIEVDRKLNSRGEFLHKSCTKIDEVDFTKPKDGQLNLFNNESEGMCGV